MSTLEGFKVLLNPVSQSDLEQLREWRNSHEIAQFMVSQEVISRQQQQAWFERISVDPCQQHWVISFRGKAIGSANIKSLDGLPLRSSTLIEPGIYIADEKLRGNIIAFSPSLVMLDYCFGILGVNKVKAHVKDDNTSALNYNKQLGYKVVSEGKLTEIELTAADYFEATHQIKKLLSR